MSRIAELAGLGHLDTHDARRTVATALDDLPPREAQTLLRHRSARVTLDTYTKARAGQGRRAIAVLDEMLTGQKVGSDASA